MRLGESNESQAAEERFRTWQPKVRSLFAPQSLVRTYEPKPSQQDNNSGSRTHSKSCHATGSRVW